MIVKMTKKKIIEKETCGFVVGVRSLRAEVSSCCAFMFTFAGSKRALRPLWRGRYRGPGRRYAFQNLGTPSQRRNPSAMTTVDN